MLAMPDCLTSRAARTVGTSVSRIGSTAFLGGIAVLAYFLRAELLLQYDRTAIAAGQAWRLVSGHWAHWSADHLAWDVAAFAALGAIAEDRSRRRFLACVFGSAAVISAGVGFLRPDLPFYRGLSGIDAALFAFVATAVAREAVANHRRATACFAIAGLGGLALKLVWELSTGSALFVDAAAAGFEPLPLAHALGAAVGAVAGAWPRRATKEAPR